MTSALTFKFLVDYLSESLLEEYPKFKVKGLGYGARDNAPVKGKVAHLCGLFEKYIYQSDKHYFLVNAAGSLFVFNGRYYENVGVGRDGGRDFLRELIKRTMNVLRVGKVYLMYATSDISRECMNGLTSTDEFLFRPDKRYWVFNNGVFDTKDGKLKAFHMRYCTEFILDIDYNPRASSILFETKLNEIFPSKDNRDAFQQFCGAFLANRNELKFEYICILIGSGANGKSVMVSAVTGVFGDHYFSRFTPQDLFKDSDKNINIAALKGKMANLCDDLDDKDFSGGMFKKFVSGEKIQGRALWRDTELIEAPLMLCCTNHIPDSTDDSYGNHRRLLRLFTTQRQWTEADMDPYLAQKLRAPEVRQAIFNWIYAGFRKLINNGGRIKLGPEVVEAQNALIADSSPIRRWIRDSGIVRVLSKDKRDPRWVSLRDLLAEYNQYADDNGYREAKSSKDISKVLRNIGCEGDRRVDGWKFLIGRLGIDTDEDGRFIKED